MTNETIVAADVEDDAARERTCLARMRTARRRGDAEGAVSLAEAAFDADAGTAAMAQAAAHAQMWAGRLDAARRWLDRADGCGPDAAQAVAVALDRAQLDVLETLDLEAGLDAASAAQALYAEGESLPLAVAWGITQLRNMAAAYREPSSTAIAALRRGYRALQRRLADAGEVDWSHSVAVRRAETLAPRRRPLAFVALAQLGRRNGVPAFVGESMLRLASSLRHNGAPDAAIVDAIVVAEAAFAQVDHRIGLLDAALERALLAVDRHGADLDVLAGCVKAYRDAGYAKGELNCLLDLSTRAHQKSRMALAQDTRERLDRLAGECGYGSMRKQNAIAQADLAMRARQSSRARDLCDEALAAGVPRILRAGLYAMRATACSQLGETKRAVEGYRKATDIQLSLDAEDIASDLVEAQASALSQSRRDDDVAQADALLADWSARDFARGVFDGAVSKLCARADMQVMLALGRRTRGGDVAEALATADRYADAAQAALDSAPASIAWAPGALHGKLQQTRSMIASVRGDTTIMQRSTQDSGAHYATAGMPFEAANSRYLEGCLYLNAANAEEGDAGFAQQVDAAATALHDALAFYEDVAGMRAEAAKTRHKLAMLYLNAVVRLKLDVRPQLVAAAQAWLEQAADDYDALRRAHDSAGRLDSLRAKARYSADAQEVDTEALRLHLAVQPDAAEAWRWAVRSKARALNDLLGLDADIPREVAAAAVDDPALRELVDRERRLATALAQAPAAQRLALGDALSTTRQAMHEQAPLREYVGLRTGAPAGDVEFQAVAASAPYPFVLVDWVEQGDALHVLVRRGGEAPSHARVPAARSAVAACVARLLSSRKALRTTLDCGPDGLSEFDALVAPLATLTRPGEHVILCPSGAILQSVPLHALPVDGVPLIERNPVAYTPSLGTLSMLRQRAPRAAAREATVFGDPSGDRPDAREAARHIAAHYGVAPFVGDAATRSALVDALATSAIVHFQGHAAFDTQDALASRLKLARDEMLDAAGIFELRAVATRLLTLGACEAGATEVRAGNEAFGLIAALLSAGVQAVAAASWHVHAISAARLMERCYDGLLDGRPAIVALREAALAVRDMPGFGHVYHWAAFRLYGDPWLTIDRKLPR